jgi:ABC-2 type transport system permease protein
MISHILRETKFLFSHQNIIILLLCSFFLCSFSVVTGINEVSKQRDTIERLKQADSIDRAGVHKKYDDPGYLAYYGFHLTYSEPSNLVFAALGERDVYPWKHRIRMLALEGQIYESDTQNAELAQIGKIDFAFVISALSPLIIILIFHDLFASERANGRYDFLVTTAASASTLWMARALVRFIAVSLCLLLPFWIGAMLSGALIKDVLWLTLLSILYFIFWTVISLYIGKKAQSAPKVASKLIGLWVLTAIVIPTLGDYAVKGTVDSPQGGEILMTQREAVNDAWDIPVDTTMSAFFKLYPEYQNHMPGEGFNWSWYYAFQHMGDEAAAPLSTEFREASKQKYTLAGKVALLSPPMLIHRAFTAKAESDAPAAYEYEQSIRQYHKALREFYYPWLFSTSKVEDDFYQKLPQYELMISESE